MVAPAPKMYASDRAMTPWSRVYRSTVEPSSSERACPYGSMHRFFGSVAGNWQAASRKYYRCGASSDLELVQPLGLLLLNVDAVDVGAGGPGLRELHEG